MTLLLPDPCTGRDIVVRLDLSADWWARNWRGLVERHGFPAPLPGMLRPRKWDPKAVETWIAKTHRLDRGGTKPPAAPAPADDAAGSDEAGDAAIDRRLAARAAHLAARGRRNAEVR